MLVHIKIRTANHPSGLHMNSVCRLRTFLVVCLLFVETLAIGSSRISIEPLDFGKVAVANCKTDVLRISNNDTGIDSICSVSLFGTLASAYTIQGNTNLALGPGEKGTIAIKFCPASIGSKNISARVITCSGDTIVSQITGQGASSTRFPPVLNFPLLAINQTIQKMAQVTNDLDSAATITGADFINAPTPNPFSTDVILPVTILPGTSINIPIRFSPTVAGSFRATLMLTRSDSLKATMSVTGDATMDTFSALPSSILDTGGINGIQDDYVMIANFTARDRSILSLDITGTGASAYRITQPISWPYILRAVSADSINIRYEPATAGDHLATLEIMLDDNTTTRIALHGLDASGLREQASPPQRYALMQNFPNPFSNVTTIRYSVADRSEVSIRICDALGRVVARPVNAVQEAGPYQVDISGAEFPARVYECVFQTPRDTVRRIMQLIK